MPTESRRNLMALAALLLAGGLACNTVTRAFGPNETFATLQPPATEEPVQVVEPTSTERVEAESTPAPTASEAAESDLEATVEALATEGAPDLGEVPADIPVVDAETSDFFAMAGLVSYSTTMEYGLVVDFYKTEMEANGWELQEATSLETSDVAVLQYEKAGRTAIISITADAAAGNTLVQILMP